MLKNHKILINEVIPFLREKYHDNPLAFHNWPLTQMIVTLNDEGKLTGYLDTNNFCKRNIPSIVKIFRFIDIPDLQEKVIREYDCCGFEKMTDIDIPLDWRKTITLNTDIDSLIVYSAV